MARLVKNPNPYSKVLDQKYTHRASSISIILLALAAAFWFTQTKNLYTAVAVLIFGLVLLSGADLVFKRMKQNDQGEDGEWEVRKILETLSDDFTIFQNVPVKHNLDIDLVLVGPIGVYAIEVKSYRKFMTYGNGKDFLNESMSEALGLKNYLKVSGIDVYVPALLVFSRAFVRYGIQREVHVMNKGYLVQFLGREQRVNFDRTKAEEVINRLYVRQI